MRDEQINDVGVFEVALDEFNPVWVKDLWAREPKPKGLSKKEKKARKRRKAGDSSRRRNRKT